MEIFHHTDIFDHHVLDPSHSSALRKNDENQSIPLYHTHFFLHLRRSSTVLNQDTRNGELNAVNSSVSSFSIYAFSRMSILSSSVGLLLQFAELF